MLGHNLSQADANSNEEGSIHAGHTGTGCFKSYEHHQGLISNTKNSDPTFDNIHDKERVEMKPIVNKLNDRIHQQPTDDDKNEADTLSLQTPVWLNR